MTRPSFDIDFCPFLGQKERKKLTIPKPYVSGTYHFMLKKHHLIKRGLFI